MKITISFTLKDGKKRTRTFKNPDSLIGHKHPEREVLLLTNSSLYAGKTTGELDEHGTIVLTRDDSWLKLDIPFGNIVGWAYMD